MPEKNNPAPQDGPAALEDACWDPDWMIWNAKSLQHVVKELDRNGLESPQLNTLLFEGKFLAGPIVLTLAIQIALKALKAWLCLERKEAPPRTHDVLKLFKKLAPDTQKLLRAEMPGWPGIRETPYKHGSLPELLYSHRNAHTYWRYIHEEHWGVFRSAELDRALTVIINAYGKRWGDSP